jgi:hypothetical protein
VIDFTTPIPLAEAVQHLGAKTPLGVALRSAELERLPVEIRDRAFFSAMVEDERILAEMQRRILQRVRLQRSKLADGSEGVTMDRARFIAEMQEELDRAGYRPDPAKAGGLQDLSSAGRLGLVWDMQLAQAHGHAKWKTSMDPDILLAVPAQELIRVEARHERRDWPAIWAANGGQFYGEPGPDYPDAPGRMMALITDEIWVKISRFGVPWPPYDWGSGMGTRSVRRRLALELGVMKRGDKPQQPLTTPFNSGLTASVKGIPQEGRERLRSEFGDAIRFDSDQISYERQPDPDHVQETVRENLKRRARESFARAERELGRLQREDGGADVGFRGEDESAIARVYLAQTSAVQVGRKQLFHDTLTQGQAEQFAEILDEAFPDLSYHYEAGHFIAWREDLLAIAREVLIQLVDTGTDGLLLGYGRESIPLGEPSVLVRIYRQPRGASAPLAGFFGPVHGVKAFAEARARDLSDALGEPMEIVYERRGL